jgi:hypothetical protein
LFAVFLVCFAHVDQRRFYWRFAAWRSQDPAAHEPSGVAFAWYRHSAPAARLGRACGELLPVDDMLAATGAGSRFGGRELKLSSHPFDGAAASVGEPEGLPVTCRVNGIAVAVETSAGSEDPFVSDSGFAGEVRALPVPLGQGWPGHLAEEGDRLEVSVLLDCENWGPERGSGVLVSLDASVDGIGGAERARFARIATRTAANAAGKAGCEAAPGSRIRRADGASAVSRVGSGRPARGTCRGTRSQASVTETPARTSPVEYCLLGSGLRLTAHYGPFANVEHVNGRGPYAGFEKPAGGTGRVAWATADCPGALGTALYTATPAQSSGRSFVSWPLTARERADLKQFATRSAARHRCGTPVLP